jgi:uridine kinase
VSVLIGVAGGTGSGKTSFANRLLERLREERCVTVAQDAYYKDGSTLDPAARAAINYDHPDAFDTSLLIQDLRDLKAGRPVPHLTYDHATYSRRVLPDALTPRPVVILEGILILAEEPLRRLMDIKLFIDTDSDVRILRRLRRDLKERGRSFESVERQYLSSVRPDASRVRGAVQALRRSHRARGRGERGRPRSRGGARGRHVALVSGPDASRRRRDPSPA